MSYIEKEIASKFSTVLTFGKTIQHKKFGINLEGGRNAMAMAIIFETNFRDTSQFIASNFKHPCSQHISHDIIERLDFLINIYTSTSEIWEEFWKGNKSIKPNMTFVSFLDEYGTEDKRMLDLNDVVEFEIKDMGIKIND